VIGPDVSSFLITCEHGGNRIPALCRSLFRGQRKLLESHRGYDPGALVMARALGRAFAAGVVSSTVSRLVIDLNRSIGHPRLWSSATRGAPRELRTTIIDRYYRPYRAEVVQRVRQSAARGRRVIHVSSHSFTPVLNGHVRSADVGLLYDPRRRGEAALCARWQAALGAIAPALRVRRNYPYAGNGDGLTSTLRLAFANRDYVGIELEINQQIVLAGGRQWTALRGTLIDSLRRACASR